MDQPPDENDPGWTMDAPHVQVGTYVWTMSVISFSNGNEFKTYTVNYNNSFSTVGMRYYTHVRYSANDDGRNMKVMPDNDTMYIGISTSTSVTAPTHYSAYVWMKLKGDDGAAGGDAERTNVVIRYARTETNERPPINSDLWQDTIPGLTESSYLWTWSAVDYSNGTHTNLYNVAYTGTDNENKSTFMLSDEHVSIGASSSGICEPQTLTTLVSAYNGKDKVVPVIVESELSFTKDGIASGRPSGMNISVGGTDSDMNVILNMTIAEGSNLSEDGATYG